MNLEDIMATKITRSQKDKYCRIPLLCRISYSHRNAKEREVKWGVVSRAVSDMQGKKVGRRFTTCTRSFSTTEAYTYDGRDGELYVIYFLP